MNMTRESLMVLDTDISIARTGTGPVVLCLHAVGHDARDFERLAKRLGSAFEFIAVDWPGQGDSPRDKTPASASHYAEILDLLVSKLQLDPFILLGNSIGGAAAIIHAAAKPENVRGLVLCDTGGLVAINWLVRLFCKSKVKKFVSGEQNDAAFGPWFERYYRTVLPQPEAGWRRDEIVAAGYRNAGLLREAWESFVRPEADIRDLTPRLSMPVLYAWAKQDKVIPWRFARKAALNAPDASVVFFDGGHSAFLEQPEKFDTAFTEFTSRLPA